MSSARQTEAQFTAAVRQYARLRGWLEYHTYRSTRSPAGFPDLVMVRQPRLIFAELKDERGRLIAAQETWIRALSGPSGVETYVWRPSDWPEIERVLS